jgi:hypothetical protein
MINKKNKIFFSDTKNACFPEGIKHYSLIQKRRFNMKLMYGKVLFSLLVMFIPIWGMASSIDLDSYGINSMEISNMNTYQVPEGLMAHSVEVSDYKSDNGSFGLFTDNNHSDEGSLRATGGGGGSFEDPGGKDNEGAYNDPAPIGTFPCLFFLCLATGYGIYSKIKN